MINATACLFPDTIAKEEYAVPLVQVFRRLVYLRPVENENPLPEERANSPLLTTLTEKQRLLPITPLPLGAQRERFLALMEDIQRYGQDYLTRLSFLTLAEMPRQHGLESRQTILGELLGGTVRNKDEEEMLLWQSRLILKLGELYDARQTELQSALRDIDERQQNLLANLQGDLDETEELLPLSDLSPENGLSELLQYRLRAWTRLFFGKQRESFIFVTPQEAALDLLLETYDKRYGQDAPMLAEFTIAKTPIKTMEPEAILQGQVEQSGANESAPLLQDEIIRHAQEARIQEAARTDRHRHSKLQFFVFPGCSPQELFSQTFCHDAAQTRQAADFVQESIVGLLRPY